MLSRICFAALCFLMTYVYGAEQAVVCLQYTDGSMGYKKGEAYSRFGYIFACKSPAGKYWADTTNGLWLNSKKITEDVAREIYGQLKGEHEAVVPQFRITQVIHNERDESLVYEPLLAVSQGGDECKLFAVLVGVTFIMVAAMKYFDLICCTQGRGY